MFLIDVIAIFILGVILGSFISMVSYRFIRYDLHFYNDDPYHFLKSLNGRSSCKCGEPIKPVMLIPVLSFAFNLITNNGGSKCCGRKISWRYPMIEIVSSLLLIISYYMFSKNGTHYIFNWVFSYSFWITSLFFLFLLTISIIDLESFIIPDNLSLMLLWVGLLVSALSSKSYFWSTSLYESVLGAALGYLLVYMMYQIHYAITRKIGFGHGDFKLVSAIGAFIGVYLLPLFIMFSGLLAIIFVMTFNSLHKENKIIKIAFGPYLSISGVIVFVFKDDFTKFLYF